MGSILNEQHAYPVEEQLRNLETEELLDFWEETQYLERFFETPPEGNPLSPTEYEKLILDELRIRFCMGAASL